MTRREKAEGYTEGGGSIQIPTVGRMKVLFRIGPEILRTLDGEDIGDEMTMAQIVDLVASHVDLFDVWAAFYLMPFEKWRAVNKLSDCAGFSDPCTIDEAANLISAGKRDCSAIMACAVQLGFSGKPKEEEGECSPSRMQASLKPVCA